ncbi:solute carrier family 22 member 7-like [Schistocerca cancellata]|uniref:solute carrier family 22 member 7-like n=1 Tax=Schistocerca cancellata TaxID=274614 RepID=UPI002117858F|nr:solute carrier family 22 member 7-like [Schistocerca cancellata]
MEENGEISTNRRNPKVGPAFEEVLDSIGSRGKFQTRLNIVFNCVGPCLNMLSINVFFLAMQTPDHWCHVPGRERANLSLEEWKNFTIPRAGNSFSKCLMYNQSDGINGVNWNSSEPVKCQHGWDYDDTWFSLTVPSQMNWVCDNQQSANDVLFYAQNIGVALSLLFGYIGDMYGRQLLQFLCLVAHMISRLLLVLTPDILVLFILAQSLVSAAAGPMHESALSVGLELADIRHRTTLNYFSSCGLGAGVMATGLLGWGLRNWNYSMYCTAALFIALISFFRWFPESPRWLACRGREEDALRLLRRIAATNGGRLPPFAPRVMRTVAKAQRDRKGFLSLFSSWNVFKNTVLLITARKIVTQFNLTVHMIARDESYDPEGMKMTYYSPQTVYGFGQVCTRTDAVLAGVAGWWCGRESLRGFSGAGRGPAALCLRRPRVRGALRPPLDRCGLLSAGWGNMRGHRLHAEG